MGYLYLDNFRGFSDTLIPLEQVNFFVGENSTGKTSVLALLDRLASDDFWSLFSFNNRSNYDFGNFEDLITAGSTKKCFHIGMSNYQRGQPDSLPYRLSTGAVLFTFANKSGVPVLEYFTLCMNQSVYRFRILRKSFEYQMSVAKSNQTILHYENPSALFSDMVHHHESWSSFPSSKKSMPYEIRARENFLSFLFSAVLPNLVFYSEVSESMRIVDDMKWFAPIRTKPKRTYDLNTNVYSPEGEHTPYLLRSIFLDRKNKTGSKVYRDFIRSLCEFGKESGLFKNVAVNEFKKKPTSPFEIQIVLGTHPINISCVGYGVSQVLPLLVELLAGEGKKSRPHSFAIQQPEVHLHPKAQAALGDLFFMVASMKNSMFFVETHSDFMIDRFRRNYRKSDFKTCTGQVLYFERSATGNKVTPLRFEPNGEYPEDQPTSFREFFLHENLENLGI